MSQVGSATFELWSTAIDGQASSRRSGTRRDPRHAVTGRRSPSGSLQSMGAWDVGVYDNDDAADWVADLTDGGADAVDAALRAVIDADYIDAPEGASGLAAADVVARLAAGGGEQSPYSAAVSSWVAANPLKPAPALVDMAVEVLSRLRGDGSELAELWADAGAQHEAWVAVVDEVESRLRTNTP